MKTFLDVKPVYDPTAKFWRCICGGCRDQATITHLYLMIILWDVDRLLALVRLAHEDDCRQ